MRVYSVFCVVVSVACLFLLSAAVSDADTITPVSATASSSYSIRTPDKTIDGSGLSAGLHDADHDNMWLTDINLPINDPWITYDLGANYHLSSFHVWNYNEPLRGRGIQDVEILTADTDVSPTWTSRGTFTLAVATGLADYAGETINFAYENVRLVKFDVASNWYGYTYPASGQPDMNAVVGLSEIRFDGAIVPEPSALVLLGMGALALLLVWCRRTA